MLPMLGFTTTRSAVHHVSSTGADDGDGSISAPWRSLSFAGRQIRPGDTLFLARNCTWFDETLVIPSAANVTIASYGPSSLPLPLLQIIPVEMSRLKLQGTMKVPLYITQARRNAMGVGLMMDTDVDTDEHTSHWILQGVALCLNIDQ